MIFHSLVPNQHHRFVHLLVEVMAVVELQSTVTLTKHLSVDVVSLGAFENSMAEGTPARRMGHGYERGSGMWWDDCCLYSVVEKLWRLKGESYWLETQA